ncbi:MAG TPA: hypothetical protein VF449_09375 [Parvibaculum sp.]
MTVLARQIPFPSAGGASWQPGQGPAWRGGVNGGWWHEKAIFAADPLNARYMRQGADIALASALAVTRSSTHLLADAAGILQSFGVNMLAANKGVGAYAGEQRTNVLYPSNAFDSATWTASNATLTADAATSPDGSNDAYKMTDNATSAFHRVVNLSTVNIAAAGAYTESYFVKYGTHQYVQIIFGTGVFSSSAYANFDLVSGTVTAVGASASAAIAARGNGWYRISVTATATGSSSNGGGGLVFIPNGTAARLQTYVGAGEYIYLFGAQIEAGKFATPYIPATSNSATRYASDVKAVQSGSEPFAGFSANGLPAGLSVLAAVNLGHTGDAALRPIAEISDGTANNRLRFYIDTDDKPAAAVVSAGTVVATAKLASALTTGRAVLAANYDPANGLYLVRKTGLEEASAALASMPPGLNTMRLGSSVSSNYLNDTVEQVQVARLLTPLEAKTWVQAA